MKPKRSEEKATIFSFALMLALFLLLVVRSIEAVPEGAGITYLSNSTKNATSPDSRLDNKGTITVIHASTISQDMKWKAYVGNVSATLVLKDAQDYSIYEWTTLGGLTGRLFITRNSSVNWASMACANQSIMQEEQTMLNISGSVSDSINNTFRASSHKDFWVGTTVHILNSTCPSINTWVNNTAQATSESSLFQEVLLTDGRSMVYTTLMESDASSYRSDNVTTYDFQAIVAEGGIPSVGPFTYYFYIEVS
jgi:hypothetical protein